MIVCLSQKSACLMSASFRTCQCPRLAPPNHIWCTVNLRWAPHLERRMVNHDLQVLTCNRLNGQSSDHFYQARIGPGNSQHRFVRHMAKRHKNARSRNPSTPKKSPAHTYVILYSNARPNHPLSKLWIRLEEISHPSKCFRRFCRALPWQCSGKHHSCL